MNPNTTNDSQDLGIIYTETIVCEKKTDSSIVSDSFMNIIRNSTIIQQPLVFEEIISK